MFTYKGRDVNLKSVALQLGVRYVVEGSLRRLGTPIRTSVQVTDVETMDNLLAEQYDYEVGDLFAIQDEIVRTIVGAISPELLRHERDRVARAPPQNANAYELYQRGAWHLYRYTKEDNEKAREYSRSALEIDPAYTHASAGLAIALWQAAHVGWAPDRKAFFEQALAHGRSAVQANSRDPRARFALGGTLVSAGFPEEAIPHLREAVRLNPSDAAAHAFLGFAFNFLDRPDEALPKFSLALRLSPHDPRRFLWLPALAISHYRRGATATRWPLARKRWRASRNTPSPSATSLRRSGNWAGGLKHSQLSRCFAGWTATWPAPRPICSGSLWLRRSANLEGLRKAGSN